MQARTEGAGSGKAFPEKILRDLVILNCRSPLNLKLALASPKAASQRGPVLAPPHRETLAQGGICLRALGKADPGSVELKGTCACLEDSCLHTSKPGRPTPHTRTQSLHTDTFQRL